MHPSRLLALLVFSLVPAFTFAEDSTRTQIAELMDKHHWAAAQPLLEKAALADPQNAEAQANLGLVLIRQDKGEQAVAPLEKAVALAPTNSEYQHWLGDAYGATAQKAGKFSMFKWAKKCVAAYEKSVALDPKNLDARTSLLGFYQQAPGIIGGGMDKAYAQAAEIKKLDPARGRIAYAGLYVADKKYAEAFATFEEVLKESPDDYASLYQFGRLTVLSGQQLARGRSALEHCLTLTPPKDAPDHAAAHWRLGMIHAKLNDKAAARTAYETSLKLDPKFKQAADALKKL